MTTGSIGSSNSDLGHLVLGYQSNDFVIATWINQKNPYNVESFIFRADEGSDLVELFPNTPTILTHAQLKQAKAEGAILLVVGQDF